jgi:hypothetical protein
VAEFWVDEGDKNYAEGFALTTSAVATVAVHGSKPVATHPEPGLPQGLRAVTVTAHGEWAPDVKTPSLFGQPPHLAPARLPRFTSLDRHGKPLIQDNGEGPLVEHELAGKNWSSPTPEPAGPCELRAAKLRGLVTNAGFVVAHLEPVEGLFGQPFLACASTSYSFKGWPIVASVLLDARRPGARPGVLPRMRAVTGAKDVYDALGSNGPMVARRIAGAWLVVGGGEGETQRQALLEDLRGTVQR